MIRSRAGTTFVFPFPANGEAVSDRVALSATSAGMPTTDLATAARVLLLSGTPTLSRALPGAEDEDALPTCFVPRLTTAAHFVTEASRNLQPTVIFLRRRTSFLDTA